MNYHDRHNFSELRQLASELRRRILDITHDTKSAHLGSCFSTVEILISLYFNILNHSPEYLDDEMRDRFLLSKGHACLALYAVLNARGFMSDEVLAKYGINGGTLEHHSKRALQWGIEASTGSLGHGLSLGAGLAKAAKLSDASYRVFVLLSDGELNEGSVWEAISFAAHHRLDNLTAIVDYNKIQALGRNDDILKLEPLVDKWRAFGWHTEEVDGHSFEELIPALSDLPKKSNNPTVVIAHTVKGKGVSFMEDTLLWHYRCPDKSELTNARVELEHKATR